MREELKQREADLEKSLDDKQQLKNQVQTLKEGLQNLQNTHVMQVGLLFFMGWALCLEESFLSFALK